MTETAPLVPKDEAPSLPTDAQCDDALQAHGFTHCFDKPYWWTIKAEKPMLRVIAEAPYPSVKPVKRPHKPRGKSVLERKRDQAHLGTWPRGR